MFFMSSAVNSAFVSLLMSWMLFDTRMELKLCTEAEHQPEGATGESLLLVGKNPVETNDTHTVSGLAEIRQIVVRQDIHVSRKLTGRCTFGKFLEGSYIRVEEVPEW